MGIPPLEKVLTPFEKNRFAMESECHESSVTSVQIIPFNLRFVIGCKVDDDAYRKLSSCHIGVELVPFPVSDVFYSLAFNDDVSPLSLHNEVHSEIGFHRLTIEQGMMNVFLCVGNTILFVRWPVAFFTLFVMAYLSYYILPDLSGNEKLRRHSALPGTIFFCVSWLIGSWGFSIYVNNLHTYNFVYGTIAGFAVMMMWLYYTSILILIGGEINSQLYEKLERKEELILKRNASKND